MTSSRHLLLHPCLIHADQRPEVSEMAQPNSNRGAALDKSTNGGAHPASGIASNNGGASLDSSVVDAPPSKRRARAAAPNQAQAPNAQALNAQAAQAAHQAPQTSRGSSPAATSSRSLKHPKVNVVEGSAQRNRDRRSQSPSDDDPRYQLGISSRRGETRRDRDEYGGRSSTVVNNYTFNMSLAELMGCDNDALANAVRKGVEAAESISTRLPSTQSRRADDVDVGENGQTKESDKPPTTQSGVGKPSGRSTTPVAADSSSEVQAVPPTEGGTLAPVESKTAIPADGATDDGQSLDYDVMDTSEDTGVAMFQPSIEGLRLLQKSLEPVHFNVITRIGGDPARTFSIRVLELEIPHSRHGVGLFCRVLDTILGDDDYQRVAKDHGIRCGFAKVESFEVQIEIEEGVEGFICDNDWATHETVKRLRWYGQLKIIQGHIDIIIDLLV